MSEPFDDEDPTPRASPKNRVAPTKPALNQKGAAPQAAAVTEVRLNWGHVGSVTKPGRLSDGTSRPGVIRVVEANIAYDTPPLDPYIWVPASLNYVGQYEMSWTEGNPTEVRSLADLGAELRADKPNRVQLSTLDHAADALLQSAIQLHARESRLGLLHPGNVLIVPGSDGHRLILPDLGFTWRGSHGSFPWRDSPGRPKWLNEDSRENANARLWDEEPIKQQFATSNESNGYIELIPVEADLRTLARVFAAVLTGRVDRDLSPPPSAPPVWNVLRSAMKGEITTAEDFRTKLSEHPLSEHWLAPKPVEKKSALPIGILMGILGLLAVGSLGTVAALYYAGVFGKPDDTTVASASSNTAPPTSGNKPPVTKTGRPLDKTEVDWKKRPATPPPAKSEIEELVKEFEATKDSKRWRELLERMYQFYAATDDETRAKARPWLEHLRGQYLDDWERRYRAADDAVIKNVALRFESGQQIYDLNRELHGLREKFEPISPSLNTREGECLLISDLRSQELGSSR